MIFKYKDKDCLSWRIHFGDADFLKKRAVEGTISEIEKAPVPFTETLDENGNIVPIVPTEEQLKAESNADLLNHIADISKMVVELKAEVERLSGKTLTTDISAIEAKLESIDAATKVP